MRRRYFLACVGSTITAGCGSNEGKTPDAAGTRSTATETDTENTEASGSPATSEPDPEETPTEEATATEQDTSTSESNVLSLERSQLVEYEEFGESTVAVDGIIRNTASQPLAYVEVASRFIDGSDTIVGESFSNLTPLLAGEAWKFRIDYYSEQEVSSSEVASYELFADYRRGDGQLNAQSLEVVNSKLIEKTEFGETTKVIQGEIRNTTDSPLEYVEATGQFLVDDIVVGSMISNTENLQPGQGWAFEVDYFSPTSTPPSEVSDYHLFATT